MPVPPETAEQLQRRLHEARPDLGLDDPGRPIVLVGGGATGARRALASDDDVQRFFAACDCEGVVELEVHDLFPNASGEKECRAVVLPARTFFQPWPQRPSASPPEKGTGGGRGSFRRHKEMLAGAPAPPSPPGLAQPPPPQSPAPRPRPGEEREAVAPPMPRAAPAVQATLAPTPLGPKAPQPGQAAPTLLRPSSAPPTARGIKQTPPKAVDEADPSTAKPGVLLNEKSCKGEAEPPSISARVAAFFDDVPPAPMSGALQSDAIDAAHVRGKYEHLWFESGRKRAALDWLLRARDSVPGAESVNLYPEPGKAAKASAKAAAAPPKSARATAGLPIRKPGFLDVGRWDEGEYCTVKEADVPALREALDSISQINGEMIARMEDKEAASASWSIGAARRRLVQDMSPHMTRAYYQPRRCLVESSWMPFQGIEVSFRIYPCGDGSAKPGDSTVYIWLSQPPGFSFTWNLRVEGCMDTAPRLWPASCQRSRVDVKWKKLEVALMKMPPSQDHLNLCFRVLQWHGPEDDPNEWLPEHHTSTSLALQVLQWTGAAGT